MIALCHTARGGKSGLHRAGCWITSSGGDPKESATENKPPGQCAPRPDVACRYASGSMAARCTVVRVKRCGKRAPVPVVTLEAWYTTPGARPNREALPLGPTVDHQGG